MQATLKSGFGAWVLFLCGMSAGSPLAADQRQAELLLYRVQEAGQEPYLSRILVTPDFLRMDQGEAAQGFILFDRKERVIYSVDPDERSILVIEPMPAKQALSEQPEVSTDELDAGDAPLVAGRKPQHWRMMVDGKGCQEALVVPGLMSGSVLAQAEYHRLLAEQHKASLAAIPAAYRDVCADAIQVFAPSALLAKGLPLRSWDINGNRQTLINFSAAQTVPAEQFILPEDFRRQPINPR